MDCPRRLDDALPLWSVHCECGSITVSGATPYNMIYAIKANKLTREMDINTIHSLVACPICVCTPQLVGWVYMMWSLRLTIHWHSLNIPRILFTFVRVFNWHNFHGILCVIHSVGVCTLCARPGRLCCTHQLRCDNNCGTPVLFCSRRLANYAAAAIVV